MCEVTIKPQSCGCKGYDELRVAFGDLNNCQLKCPFCFTLEQKPPNDTLSSLRERNLNQVRVIRFTGGEPLRYQSQIDGMVRELREIERHQPLNLHLVVIQTNAWLENVDINTLFEFSLPILFEVSLKGMNEKEYQYLTYQQPVSQRIAENVMTRQLRGYEAISNKCASRRNISILARLGIFHSSVRQPTFRFVFPDTKELMFNPQDWHPKFRDVLQDQNRVWGSAFERKLVVEKIKTPADGNPRIGRRYRAII